MNKFLINLVLCLLGSHLVSRAQTTITLQECYALADQNYPAAKQHDLIAKTIAYNIENLQQGYLPQFSVNGQATYQSDVTALPIKVPGVTVPTLSKDQYKLYGELNQVIYDGGTIKNQKELQKANENVEQQKLQVELYQLKERINQLFFGVLLLNEQLKQTGLLIKDIQLGMDKVQAAIDNGTALKSNGYTLKADLLKNQQRLIELNAQRKAYLDILSLFINRELTENTVLVKPQTITPVAQINRPELLIYANQDKTLDVQNKLLTTKTLPKVGFFLQGGAGRPALNFLSNNFDPYYITGVRLSWSPSVFYTLKRDRSLLDINRKSLAVQKETFLFNTNLMVKQQSTELNKYQALLLSDDEIITLRNQVKTTAVVQLENGTINSSDYLREVNAEDQARQNKLLHEIQLLLAQYSQQTTTGNL